MPTFRYRLLFVGVNAVPGHPPLHAAARDAEAMSARFRGWGYDHRARHVLLLNQDATAARVTDEIQSARSAADLDLLLIYWAGHLHASGRKHVLGHARRQRRWRPGRHWPRRPSPPRLAMTHGVGHRVLILDACHATPAFPSASGPCRGMSLTRSAWTVLASGASDSLTREDSRRGYSPAALLEQMPRESRGLPPGIDLLAAMARGRRALRRTPAGAVVYRGVRHGVRAAPAARQRQGSASRHAVARRSPRQSVVRPPSPLS